MPSPAFTKFDLAHQRALILHRIVGDTRLRPQPFIEREAICHATHAAIVAAWNAYIVIVVGDFMPAVSKPADLTFNAMHTLVSELFDSALGKFNTPNAENSRNLLTLYTGYDPINDWIWPQRGMGGPQVRERLNEILKVRHSFAHGFPIPPYTWTQHASGQTGLTKSSVETTSAFIKNLVKRTDQGLNKHLFDTYSVSPW